MNIKVHTLNENGEIKIINAPYVWKLKHKGKMIKVKLKNWHSITTTPEHPFLTNNGWIKAENIKKGMYVAIPRKIYGNEDFEKFIEFINSKILTNELIVKVNEKDLKNVELPSTKIYKKQKNVFRSEDIIEHNLNIEKISFSPRIHRCGKPQHYIKLPKSLNEWKAIFYFAGVMFGDGCVDRIANNDEEVFNKLKSLNNLGIEVERIKRKSSYEIIFKNGKNALINLLKILFDYPSEKKSHNIKIPQILYIAPKELVAEFIKGYFDADGYVNLRQNRIEVISASKEFIEGLSILLLRFEITSKIYEIKKSYKETKKKYYQLNIVGKRNLKNFKNIGFSIKYKEENLNKIIEKSRKSEKYPINKDMKRLRILFGMTRNEVNVSYYAKYENGKEIPSYEIVKKFLNSLKPKNLDKKIKVLEGKERDVNYLKAFESDGLIENGRLTKLGREALNIWKNHEFGKENIDYMKSLIENIAFVEVEDVEIIDYDGYVYDLTTETHNFIANGIVVHNTTLLDKIRKTRVAKREAGGITQHIGASEIPIDVIKRLCGDLLKMLKADLKIPGLLVIDTPGHEAFTSLRKRGGALADIAILVVDINEGFKPQTVEAVNILRQCKTPFVVAANKIDLIPGWNSKEGPFILNFNEKISIQML